MFSLITVFLLLGLGFTPTDFHWKNRRFSQWLSAPFGKSSWLKNHAKLLQFAFPLVCYCIGYYFTLNTFHHVDCWFIALFKPIWQTFRIISPVTRLALCSKSLIWRFQAVYDVGRDLTMFYDTWARIAIFGVLSLFCFLCLNLNENPVITRPFCVVFIACCDVCMFVDLF